MLKPDYFDNSEKLQRILDLYSELQDFILNDIAERLIKNQHVTATADRLLWQLQQMGESREEIMRKLEEITRLSRKELKALLQDAVLTSWADEKPFYESIGATVLNPLENPEILKVIDAQYKRSLSELSNLTGTTLEQSQKDLLNMLNEMDMRVSFGTTSPITAMCEILDRYAGKGIMVQYPTANKRTGRQTTRTLEAAVRCAIVTSAMQMTGQMTAEYIAENNVGYVCVSAHMGARVAQKGQPPLADHSLWQGKIYKLDGEEEGFPNLLESTGCRFDREGRRFVTENMLGLYGYNCAHSAKPCSKDYENPWRDKDGNVLVNGKPMDDVENRKIYEAKQKARAMERAIRKTKRQLLMKEKEINGVAETDVKEILQPKYDKLAYKLRTQNKRYNEFLAENGMKKEIERTKKSGFGRKQAAKANGAATRYHNQHKDD